jgi:hypothetical protein
MPRPVRRLLADFLQWHSVQPVLNQARESLYQAIVQRDLARWGILDDFYPLGGAASYALLYLLVRLLRENRVTRIVELGSGESTRLIDRVKAPGTRHICYENDPDWFDRTKSRLVSCDYRLRPLRRFRLDAVEYDWYGDADPDPFDVLLVDGPIGTPSLSRIGCWQLIEANSSRDYAIIIDDSTRAGEQATIDFLLERLRRRGDNPVFHRIESGNVPAVIGSGRFDHVRFY